MTKEKQEITIESALEKATQVVEELLYLQIQSKKVKECKCKAKAPKISKIEFNQKPKNPQVKFEIVKPIKKDPPIPKKDKFTFEDASKIVEYDVFKIVKYMRQEKILMDKSRYVYAKFMKSGRFINENKKSYFTQAGVTWLREKVAYMKLQDQLC